MFYLDILPPLLNFSCCFEFNLQLFSVGTFYILILILRNGFVPKQKSFHILYPFNILAAVQFIHLKLIWLCCSWVKMVLVRNQARMIRSLALMSGPYLPKNLMVCGKGKYCLSLTTSISIFVLWMISLVFAVYYMKLVSSRGCWDMLPVLCFLLKEVWIHVWFHGTGKHL